jgi:hypothetical protein
MTDIHTDIKVEKILGEDIKTNIFTVTLKI